MNDDEVGARSGAGAVDRFLELDEDAHELDEDD